MPSRRSGGVGTTRRKHSLGNLRRAHPASGATWNVQVVRGKMSSKCLWHACRALILGLALMLLGAGMATLGYYADHLSMGSELRGNVTVRVKNDLKGFHLNNFSYVGPIVMGFGGFIVVASCVMTFEARDSAAKVVPARLRAGGGSCNKSAARSNQGSSASQRRGMGAQYQSTRWDQHFGVFRSSPGDPHQQLQAVPGGATSAAQQQQQQPFDREALTAELIKFSKSLRSSSTRYSPQLQLRRLTFTGSVPDLSAIINASNDHQTTPTTTTTTIDNNYCYNDNNNTNPFNLFSEQQQLLLLQQQQQQQMCCKRHHHHHNHHHHHRHHHQQQQQQHKQQRKQQLQSSSSVRRVRQTRSAGISSGGGGGGGAGSAGGGAVGVGSSTRLHSNSSSLIQRATREYATCTLLQPPAASRVYWQASSFDAGMAGGGATHGSSGSEKRSERNKRSDTAKRHVLARQRPIEQDEAAAAAKERERERCSPQLGHRRNSTMSDSSYSGRWTARCASVASRTSSIDSRRIQVDLHSPEVMPKSILRSPKRYSSGPSATPSVEKEFRSQLSVCSEPPPPVRQLSGQSSMEPAVPEESVEIVDERLDISDTNSVPQKKPRPDFLPLGGSIDQPQQQQQQQKIIPATLYRSNSSRQFYRPKPGIANERDDSVFYIRSLERGASSTSADEHMYDSLRVINERRSTLLKADSQSSLGSAERKLSSFSLKMPDITERENSVDIEDPPPAISKTPTELETNPNPNETM